MELNVLWHHHHPYLGARPCSEGGEEEVDNIYWLIVSFGDLIQIDYLPFETLYSAVRVAIGLCL